MLKRFLVFYGDVYYPRGGMNDFADSFETSDEAVSFLFNKDSCEERGWHYTWGHIYDSLTQTIFWESERE